MSAPLADERHEFDGHNGGTWMCALCCLPWLHRIHTDSDRFAR